MIFVGFLILFGFSCVLFSCEGKDYPPSYVKTVISGSTVRLKWTFRADPSKASLAWFFTRRRVGSKEEYIAKNFRNSGVSMFNSNLPRVAIEQPTTLVLKNVDERYNGKYRFSVRAYNGGDAVVELFILAKPNVTINNCSDPTAVNEGDDLVCVCRCRDGNPPANLTWYDKEGNQISDITFGENILTLTNVTKQDSGRYTCKAQSYLVDKKSFELIVRLNYQSTVAPLGTTTQIFPTTENSRTANTAANKEHDGTSVVLWHIVISSVSGIIIGILLSYIVSCSHRRWFRDRKPERYSEPRTSEVDTTYQELDLSRMKEKMIISH